MPRFSLQTLILVMLLEAATLISLWWALVYRHYTFVCVLLTATVVLPIYAGIRAFASRAQED